MIKTIRMKLILVFSFFILMLIIMGILMNTFFLENFYIYKNKETFLNAEKEILASLKQDPPGVSELISEIDRLDGISVMITEGSQRIKYVSYPMKQGNTEDKIPKEIEAAIRNNPTDEIYTTIARDKAEAPKLAYINQYDMGYIILTKPLKGLRESVDIANQFYLVAGFVIIIIGFVAAYFISRNITIPIVEMSKTAEKISNLDFGDHIKISSSDEIGILGGSINKMSEKLNLSMDRLTRDIERRKQMVRDMSHELKTPIGVMKGYAEGLKYGVIDDPEKKDQYCTVISNECDRMDLMVKQLLELAMLEEAAGAPAFTTFPISMIVDLINQRYDPIMSQSGYRFEISEVDEFEINADPVLLERAVSNLLTNAIKYNDSRKIIKLSFEKAGSEAHIRVFNTGEGISEDIKEKVFDVFYKADKARSRDSGGSGIGLAIVKSVLDLHHGSAEIVNRDGGVEIILKMPLDFTSIS